MVRITLTRPVAFVSADTLWDKLALYSEFDWHPLIVSSENIGTIPDKSDNMVGAVRMVVNTSGAVLTETVREWSDLKRYQKISIDKGGPPIAKSLHITLHVRETNDSKCSGTTAVVDLIVDLQLKGRYRILAPYLSVVLRKKLEPLIDGVAKYIKS